LNAEERAIQVEIEGPLSDRQSAEWRAPRTSARFALREVQGDEVPVSDDRPYTWLIEVDFVDGHFACEERKQLRTQQDPVANDRRRGSTVRRINTQSLELDRKGPNA
jgi:hypothetical protein